MPVGSAERSGEMYDFDGPEKQPWYNYAQNIQKVSIGSGVTKIGICAFMNFANLQSISGLSHVKEIGSYAFCASFWNYESAATITIRKSNEVIGFGAFAQNPMLNYKVEEENPNYCAVDGHLLDKNKEVLYQAGALYKTSIKLPETVIGIAPLAMASGSFESFANNKIQALGDMALYDCYKLQTVKLDAIEGVGIGAFGLCTSLESITFPTVMTEIYDSAFDNCTALKSITFQGNAPTFNGDNIFYGVTATAYYNGSKSGWTSSVKKNYGGTITWKDVSQKSENTITASNIEKNTSTSDQTFSLGASVKGGAKLSYSSDNSSITVDSSGNCTIKKNYIGRAYITITSAETSEYKSATKKIKVVSYPVKATITSLTYTNNNIILKMKKDIGDVNYQIEYAMNSNYEDSVLYEPVSYSENGYIVLKNPTVGKTYYFRMRGTKVVDGVTINGAWSTTQKITVSNEKQAQTITADDFEKIVASSDQSFSLGASAKGGAVLSYSSDNSSVTVNSNGNCTIKKNYIGQATITINAAETSEYKSATKTITVTVNPVKAAITSLTQEGSDVIVKMSNDIGGVSYDIEWDTDSSFDNPVYKYVVSYDTNGYVVSGLEEGKTYYFRIRGTKKVNGVWRDGSWSSVKSITISNIKKENTIIASDITKVASSSARTVTIDASVKGGAKLKYSSDNDSITVNSSGKVTIKKNYVGRAAITITSAETDEYKSTTKTIEVRINPVKAKITSLTTSGTEVVVKVNKDIGNVDYDIKFSTDSSFEDCKYVYDLSYNSSGYRITNLKKGKTYYFTVRGTKAIEDSGWNNGAWSDVKKITVGKKEQKITASNMTKTVSSKERSFSIGAKCKGGAKLTYKSSSSKVKVKNGKVVIPKNYIGKATITVTAKATDDYKSATKKITVTVKPAKVTLTSATSKKESGKYKIVMKHKKGIGSVKYQFEYATNAKFNDATRSKEWVSYDSKGVKFKVPKKGTYYVRVRACKKVSGTPYYGTWSDYKKVKVK